MLLKHKSFLDELGTLLRKYNVDCVKSEDNYVKFSLVESELSFEIFYKRFNGDWVFENVVSTQDYSPEDPPEVYSGDENFDD